MVVQNVVQNVVQTAPQIARTQKGQQYVLKEAQKPIVHNILPPMLNMSFIQNYIKTGKTHTKTEAKTAKELLFEEDWS